MSPNQGAGGFAEPEGRPELRCLVERPDESELGQELFSDFGCLVDLGFGLGGCKCSRVPSVSKP